MNISSLDFADGGKIPKACARLGGNRRPTLHIAGVPANAKSLAAICHDPDAPGRDGFYHWTAWNVPAKTTEITGESLPTDVVEGVTSWGHPGWNEPQPPFGTHRYQFYVYALDTILDLPSDTKPKELIAALTPHIIDQVVLTGKFGVFDIFRRG